MYVRMYSCMHLCMHICMYVCILLAWSVDVVGDDVAALNVSNHICPINFAIVPQIANLNGNSIRLPCMHVCMYVVVVEIVIASDYHACMHACMHVCMYVVVIVEEIVLVTKIGLG